MARGPASGILPAVDVTDDLVRRTASLARLALSDAEVQRAVGDLSRILAHVDALSESGIDAAASTVGAAAPVTSGSLRTDEARPSVAREAVMQNAPSHDEIFFLVPKVLDGD